MILIPVWSETICGGGEVWARERERAREGNILERVDIDPFAVELCVIEHHRHHQQYLIVQQNWSQTLSTLSVLLLLLLIERQIMSLRCGGDSGRNPEKKRR